MRTAVIEVGPQTVRGPDPGPREWISVAIECVDDEVALLDAGLVEVRRLWRDLLELVAGKHPGTLVLVIPTWWSSARVGVLTEAARGLGDDVVVMRRASVLVAEGATPVVELAEEFAVIAAPAGGFEVLSRAERDIAGYLSVGREVLIDVPGEVAPFGPAFAARLRADGILVVYSDRQRMMRSVGAELVRRAAPEPTLGRRRRTVAVLLGALATLAAAAGGWLAQTPSVQPPADTSTVMLVEGRVAVRVPAQWAVEKITSGPGSARVRVSAPASESTALHVTQSAGTASSTIVEVAETLRRALESERPGVFRDLDPAGSVGGRPAVTYREIRADSETSWAVLIAGVIRVAIGCQSPPGRPEAIQDACVRAVRSTHVVR